MNEENKISQPEDGFENSSDGSELTDKDLDQVSGGTKNSGVSPLKLDGVDGESSHKDHKGEIEILSW